VWLIRVKKSHEGFRVSRDMSLLVQPGSPIHKKNLKNLFFKTIKIYFLRRNYKKIIIKIEKGRH
jgi:hypothetical protein